MTSQRGSYQRFLGAELALSGFSFLAAFFLATSAYPMLRGLYDAIALLWPAPYAPTGFTLAYASFALLIFLAVNSLLFFLGKRKL